MADNESSQREARSPIKEDWYKEIPSWFVSAGVASTIIISILGIVIFIALVWQLLEALFISRNHEAVRNLSVTLLGLLGTPFVIWRVLSAHRQAKTGEQAHHTNLFTSAINQLGADRTINQIGKDSATTNITKPNIEVRVGGIYALERLSQMGPDFYWPVIESLNTYVVENSPKPIQNPFRRQLDEPASVSGRQIISRSQIIHEWAWPKLLAPRTDIQVAISVICRRPLSKISTETVFGVCFKGANLQSAEMHRARLPNADFHSAHLEGANLSEADLQNARFLHARLEGAFLRGADLREAFFRSAYLEGADLIGAKLQAANLSEARLESANLERANLESANLTDTIVDGADVKNAIFEGAVVYGVDFSRVVGLSQLQIDSIFEGDCGTILPADLDKPKHWSPVRVCYLESIGRLQNAPNPHPRWMKYHRQA